MKITHKEAWDICDDMELELEESVRLTAYFEQQEKKDKLLELYQRKEFYGRTVGATEKFLKLCGQIKIMEEELK